MVAGWGMYLLAASIFANKADRRGEWAGLAAAVAYMYAPYLLVNAYTRGALAELMAQALLPFVFWATYRTMVAQRPLRYAVIMTLTIAALGADPQHHTAFFAGPVDHLCARHCLAAAAAVRAAEGTVALDCRCRRCGHGDHRVFLAARTVGAPGILAHPRSTLGRNCRSTSGHHGANSWRPTGRMTISGATFRFASALPNSLWAWSAWWSRGGAARYGGTGSSGAQSAFLGITPLAVPLWKTSSYLQLAQFPWRLLTVICLSFAIVTGGIVTAFNRRWLQIGTAAAIVGHHDRGQPPPPRPVQRLRLCGCRGEPCRHRPLRERARRVRRRLASGVSAPLG